MSAIRAMPFHSLIKRQPKLKTLKLQWCGYDLPASLALFAELPSLVELHFSNIAFSSLCLPDNLVHFKGLRKLVFRNIYLADYCVAKTLIDSKFVCLESVDLVNGFVCEEFKRWVDRVNNGHRN